jgi:hypothetical protein
MIIRCLRRFAVLIVEMAQNLLYIIRLCQSNLILFFDQLNVQNNISLVQIFHIKTLAQECIDLIYHIKTCLKDQYNIDI